MRILAVGELNPDLILASLTAPPQAGREVVARDFALRLGSSSAICASGLAKLGNETAFVGAAGDDIFGKFCLERLTAIGVDVSFVRLDPALRTGLTVSISDDDRALVTYPGAMETLRAGAVTDDMLRGCQHVHVSAYFLQTGLQSGLVGLFERAQALGLTTSLDPGHDPSEGWGSGLRAVFQFTNVLFFNDVELKSVAAIGEVDRALESLGSDKTLVIVKLGSSGCAALGADGAIAREAAIAVDVVDTTGAGDSFNAGFLHGWLRNWGLTKSLQCGVICGGLSTQGLGGCAAQPKAAELEAKLAELGPQ